MSAAGAARREGTELAGDDPARLATVSLETAARGGRPPACAIVDASVHVRPRSQAEFRAYLPRLWKTRRLPSGDGYYYPNPAGNHLRETYSDAGPPGSDPDLLHRHLITDGGVDRVVLHPLTLGLLPDIDLLGAVCSATNAWLADTWLGPTHDRFHGTIRVAPGDPVAAVAEIERWAAHPGFVQVGVPMQSLQPYGKRQFWPVWEAAAAHGLPVCVHADAETGVEHAPTPAGYLHTHFGHAAVAPFMFVNHLTSLMTEGVLDHLPGLRVVFADGGFDLLGPMMWRLDKDYRAMRVDMPWMTRLPSEYLAEQVRFVAHRMDGPDDAAVAGEWLSMVDADRLLVYGSNYPNWDFLPPGLVYPDAAAEARERILHGNATRLYELDRGETA
ncbi:amidohydrolase family protein [Pseudonocardia sp. KRD291]|uniref:amidohydrolase family protein n=1 Tax=Pseudonocardia sp. KRD291 TaxID=2792007 RepID=UPI001C4A6BBF|nr:amidohydrolase family protein [Pseudonocardia sp. KRD291]MBW0102415.1 amidohydrolase family protein [Pseudonocardia sp. KRD291]